MRFKGQGAGLGVWASGLQGAGFEFYGTGFRVKNATGFSPAVRVWDLGSRVWGGGCRVQGVRFGV